MTNYVPTQQELEEMGFEIRKFIDFWYAELWLEKSHVFIYFKHNYWTIATKKFYPTSRKDIETIIRLFTSDSD